MTESIYNNAGMPSEQGAAPEVPEDLRGLYESSKLDTTTFVGSQIRQLIRRIAALTLERDTLKAEIAEGNKIYEAVCAKFDGCPHAQQVNGICGCSFDDKDDVCALHAPQLKKALEEAATLKAERDALLRALIDEDAAVIHRVTSKVLAARASTPPPHPINDDDQRRKDAGWNDRPKARCVCGEMIAWYSGEYLHVAGRSKSCADGRLASPAHFLVGMPPAEPEWQRGKP